MTILQGFRDRADYQTTMPNPLAGPARMATAVLPNWLKIDALGQGVALWFLLDTYGFTQNDKLMVIGVNSVVHGVLHGIACRQQEPIFASGE